ncbi:hypothetical protein ATO3_14510 [Marinibacterium profundimaris]|uniref:YdhG-like domain-containing protein n=2 Tax=Marinibacterium profundimaris TaxID=1679460 RepID=A0A225NHW3_9RHOB|nr:hypothetical protein ATO3_14510 [Marinibacterium profundimaris]
MKKPERDRALALRALVLRVAEAEGIAVEETLKWGEPAYLPGPGGTTVRIGPDRAGDHVKLLVNCRTSLVEDWRAMFGDRLAFEGSRAVRIPADGAVDEPALEICVAMALSYHRDKRAGAATGRKVAHG